MAEKVPKSHAEKAETKEKPAGDILTPEDKTEGFEETGYGSAPGSSDFMSGAESSIWTSDESKPQGEISEATSGGLDVATQPADTIKKPASRKPKLGFFKKASPVAKLESTAELTENLIPPQEVNKAKVSPRKTKSRSKFTSGLPKLVSLRKSRTSDKSQSYSPGKKEKDSKTSPKKSPIRKPSSGIPTPVMTKKESLVNTLQDEKHAHSTEKEKSVTSQRFTKSASSPSKAKSSEKATSVHSEVPPQTAESEKAGECSVKPKKAPKFSFGKFKTTKQVTTAESPPARQSSPTEVKSDSPSATASAYALVRKGIKKMDVSGKLRKTTKKAEVICLIEKDKKTEKSKSKRRQDYSSEDRISLHEPYVYRETSWKPGNSAQEGGFLAEEMIAYVSSSEKDTTPTEMSTLSDSAGLIRGKSKSQRSRHRTLDSLSKVSSFEEEEVVGASGLEGDARPQLQRQTNVPDLEMEEDCGDVFDSPKHDVTPGKECEDEAKE